MSVSEVWGSADYGPTALRLAPATTVVGAALAGLPSESRVLDLGAGHGHLTELLAATWDTVALEPVSVMREVGQQRCPGVRWIDAYGEDTGLPDSSVDAIASNFGAFLCDPVQAAPEWLRILSPGGILAFTAWDRRGFLAEMTLEMMAAGGGSRTQPPHMTWADPGVAEERLQGFTDITVTRHDLPWVFDSVEEGMALYREGSPTHAFSFARAGGGAGRLEDALRSHLEANARASGRIESFSGYVLVTARAPGD